MTDKIAVVRLRSSVKAPLGVEDTLRMLGLRAVNSMAVIAATGRNTGMVKKVDGYVTWGETSLSAVAKLHPPAGGFRSLKKHYPRGDLGYRGAEIDDLIRKMSSDAK